MNILCTLCFQLRGYDVRFFWFRLDPCDGPVDFKCQDGQCLTVHVVCDGNYDCNDKSDEIGLQCREYS